MRVLIWGLFAAVARLPSPEYNITIVKFVNFWRLIMLADEDFFSEDKRLFFPII